jgi:hypothetical protein
MPTTRTYTTEEERQAALAAAREEYARTGVLATPMPAALAAHEAVRHGRAAFGVTRPAAPAPTTGPAVSDQEVAAVAREAVAMLTDAAAASHVARRLRAAGGDPATVNAAMRQVQAERDIRRDPGW